MNEGPAELKSLEKMMLGLMDMSKKLKDIKQRKQNLDLALTLGNLEHVKIKIYFEDDEGPKVVDTTIWGVTDSRVILKQGVVIPVNRIHKII